jgi:hypothetical protein
MCVQMIYFPETNNTMKHGPVMVILYNCCTMHNSTHSVHKRLLKLWRVHLLHLWPCRYVPSPPLSGANCQPFPPPGGPGPPASKMAPFSPGSTHTPFPLSVTDINLHNNKLSKARRNSLQVLTNYQRFNQQRGKHQQRSKLWLIFWQFVNSSVCCG